jgi:hypothetical protein
LGNLCPPTASPRDVDRGTVGYKKRCAGHRRARAGASSFDRHRSHCNWFRIVLILSARRTWATYASSCMSSSSKKHPWIEVQPAAAHLADFSGMGPSTMARTAEAENGVPRRVTWPTAASSLLILRNDRRLPLRGDARRRRFASSTTSGRASACDLRPSHLPSSRRLRSRAPRSLRPSLPCRTRPRRRAPGGSAWTWARHRGTRWDYRQPRARSRARGAWRTRPLTPSSRGRSGSPSRR